MIPRFARLRTRLGRKPYHRCPVDKTHRPQIVFDIDAVRKYKITCQDCAKIWRADRIAH